MRANIQTSFTFKGRITISENSTFSQRFQTADFFKYNTVLPPSGHFDLNLFTLFFITQIHLCKKEKEKNTKPCSQLTINQQSVKRLSHQNVIFGIFFFFCFCQNLTGKTLLGVTIRTHQKGVHQRNSSGRRESQRVSNILYKLCKCSILCTLFMYGVDCFLPLLPQSAFTGLKPTVIVHSSKVKETL